MLVGTDCRKLVFATAFFLDRTLYKNVLPHKKSGEKLFWRNSVKTTESHGYHLLHSSALTWKSFEFGGPALCPLRTEEGHS